MHIMFSVPAMVPHLWALSKLSPKLLHMVLMYQNDTVITQGSGAHNTYTSSTRMELEAIRRALQSLCGLNDNLKSVIFATGFPHKDTIWLSPWQLVALPRDCNEEADQLAASCHTRTPLELFSSDVKLLGTERWKRNLCSSIDPQSASHRERQCHHTKVAFDQRSGWMPRHILNDPASPEVTR